MTKIVQVIQPSGHLDRQHLELLEQEIKYFLEQGVELILLDCQDIVDIEQSNILRLKQIQQKVIATGGNFYICSLNEQGRSMMEITDNLEYFNPLTNRQEFEEIILSSKSQDS